MAINEPLFINEFQKGSAENANIGFGTFVGVETYSSKGVARLTKETSKISGSVVTDLPVYFAGHTETDYFAQGDTGKVYRIQPFTGTVTDISPVTLGIGKGLVFFDDVLYAFRGGNIDYHKAPYDGSAWVQGWQTGLVGNENCPFIYPNARGFYFGNGFKLGILRQQTAGIKIDPANAATYFYDNAIFQLPSIYEIKCLSFLPPNLLMIGTGGSGVGNDTQIADLISWDTVSLNLFGAPLRLYSRAGSGAGGINQLINRNNTLYAVTGGNQAIFETNGSTFNLLADLSLHSSARVLTGTGEQATSEIFLNPRTSAITVLGNKLLTGVSTSITSVPSGYGTFPLGVWSVAFGEEDTAMQCEYTISTGTIIKSSGYTIGALRGIAQGQLMIGWQDGSTYGIDVSDFSSGAIYQQSINEVILESTMFEIGTPLTPVPFTTIQLNFVRNLLTNQQVKLYARTGFDKPFTLLETFNGDNTTNAYKNVSNPLGATRYLQIRIQMATGSDSTTKYYTPELRNVIIK